MKILKHGKTIVFECPECGCRFSELPKKCYSSTGQDGAHYCESCPDCGETCWQTDVCNSDADGTTPISE